MSAYIIKNTSGVDGIWCGQEIASTSEYTINVLEKNKWQIDQVVLDAIANEDLQVGNGDVFFEPLPGIEYLTGTYVYSLAVDKGSDEGIDQVITGEWTVINHEQILWDFHDDYDVEVDDFVVPFDGVFFFDMQLKFINLINVDEIEVAIFKRGSPDDYWFILDKKTTTGLTEIQVSGATSFNMLIGERYCIKAKLTGTDCSGDISGNDDYTAWGYNLVRVLG